MKKQNTYLVIGAVIVLAITGIYGYSTLDIMSGTGTINDPYQVRTWTDLDSVRNDRDAHYILMNNLDQNTEGYNMFASPSADSGKGWLPISSYSDSSGSFNGNGYTIRGLYINRPVFGSAGLFGVMRGYTIKNTGVIDANVVGNRSLGILIGEAAKTNDLTRGTTIENCFTTGTITGVSSISTVRLGGLVGYVFDLGSVKNCWSGATVINQNGGSRIAGLLGQAGARVEGDTHVENSFSYGLVDTNVLDLSYNSGFIGVIKDTNAQNCFWDIETSGKSSSSGGTPATTVELKTISTFQNAGWDISTGTDTIWTIKSGSYPTLSIFQKSSDPQPTPGFEIVILIASIVMCILLIEKRKRL